MQVSCLKDKPNMIAVGKGDTLSCTWSSKIAAKGVGMQHLGAAGHRE